MAVAINSNCIDYLSAKLGEQSLCEFWLPDPGWSQVNIRRQSRECRRTIAQPSFRTDYLWVNHDISSQKLSQEFENKGNVLRSFLWENKLDRKENVNPNRESFSRQTASPSNVSFSTDHLRDKSFVVKAIERGLNDHRLDKKGSGSFSVVEKIDDESEMFSDSEQELLAISKACPQNKPSCLNSICDTKDTCSCKSEPRGENSPNSKVKCKRKRVESSSCTENIANCVKKHRPSIDFHKMTISTSFAWKHGQEFSESFFIPID